MKRLPVFLSLLLTTSFAGAQTYQFDGDLATAGLQNGNGNWSTDGSVSTNLRWYKSSTSTYSAWDNSGLAIAEFGYTSSTSGGTLTLDGEIKLAGMIFDPLGTPLGTTAHAFTGGTLNFGEGGLVSIANAASGGSTGGQWITFTSLLKGSNLTFQKSGGSTTAFVRISSVNPDLTGTLTLSSAAGATGGIYLSVGLPTYISSLGSIDVKTYSIFNPTGAGTYTTALTIAGVGTANYGAVRVDASNSTFSGAITLSGDARFHTHINTVNTTISGGIGETGGSWSFSRTAYAPVNTLLPLTLTYAAPSTYTGATVLGRALSYVSTSENAGTEGGVNILDFTAATASTQDMLYHGTMAGALQLLGGLTTRTELQLVGAAGKANSQTFSSLSVQQSASAITLVSGFGGSMSVDLGAITRTGSAVLAITAPVTGQITGSVGGATQGLVGAWATYRSGDGRVGGWAGLTDGVVGVFAGDLVYQTGANVSVLPGYTTTANLQISGSSTGAVSFTAGVTDLATLSMTDTGNVRQLDLAGKTLRLADSGGVQIIQGAQALAVGSLGDGSFLTAGGVDNAAGQLLLTNMSTSNALTINASIANNGSGSVSLQINGVGRTVLAAANTFSGVVTVDSGVLEVRDSNALGTTGSTGITKIMTGASLNLSGGITLNETIQANGHGIALDGAIRNLSGVNTITPTVRIQSTTRFGSDSGALILAGGITAQIGATSYTFSGRGNFEVHGAITATSGILTKEGSGTLTLMGTSTATGITTVNNGVLHLDFSAADAPAANMLYTNVTLSSTVGTLTLGGGTFKTTGKVDGASSQALGTLTIASGSSRITAVSSGTGSMDITFGAISRTVVGGTLRLDLPTLGSIKTTSGADNALVTGTGGVAFATVGLDDWAATTAAVSGLRFFVGLSSISGYTLSTATTLADNADIASGITATTLSASASIGSLRFNQSQATTLTQDASSVVLTLGGILVTPNVGANLTTITGGGMRAAVGSTELTIFQNNLDAPLTIRSRILNTTNSGGTVVGTALTKTGAGTVIYEYDTSYTTGDYSGATRIQDGALQLVKTTSSSISYAIYYGTTFTLGSGSTSGKLILGSTSTGYAVTQYGGLRTEGTGSNNAVVGGTTSLSTFLHYVSGTFDFRGGFIGGSGTNENNLNLTISLGTLQLGAANTYRGKTTLLQNTIEVTSLADRGQASSLGTGDYNSATSIIDMATATTSAQNYNVLATLRYIGDTDSVTNRPINISNADVATDVISVTAVLENTGTGTVKFTSPFTAAGSNPVQRVLRLGGTNTGANEIVSLPDVSVSITSKIEKVGTGTWIITGNSTYSGGTTVTQGTLLVTTATGSGTGLGAVSVQSGAVFGGSGRVAPGADQSVTLTGGTLQIGTELPGGIRSAASTLTIQTSGTGVLSFSAASVLNFDLFSGAGQGDNTGNAAAADRAIISGAVSLDADTLLRVSNPNDMTGWAEGDQWRLFDWSGLTSPVSVTTIQYDLPTLTAGLIWDTSELFTTGVLIVAVPEPSRALLLLFATLAIVLQRRRM
jgi:fibronectin-binding autotransporter adhesin